MDWNLKDRKVVITGASEGIGRALALAFANAGARVAGCARGAARLTDLSQTLEGQDHLLKQADLANAGDIQRFYHEVMAAFGGVDVLINNAGAILKPAAFFDLTDEDWTESFQINLLSAVRMSRAFIPALKNSGAPRIINISSIAAAGPGDRFPHYSAMKAGLSNLTVSLARTLAPDNITVNTVSPGLVWTRSWENEAAEIARKSKMDLSQTKDRLRAEAGQIPLLKRMGVPEDVTGAVLFLASDHARWITAANFNVDGGTICDPF